MKKLTLTLSLALASLCSYSQFTTTGNPTTTMDNVGIGTTTPGSLLHLYGTAATALTVEGAINNAAYGRINLVGRPSASGHSVGYIQVNSTYGGQVATGVAAIDFAKDGGGIDNKTFVSISTNNGTSLAERLRVSSSGNVGIGTISPLSPLHVVDNSRITTNDFLANGVNGSELLFQLGASTGNTYSKISALSSGEGAWNNLVLQSGGGNVGIGTTSPSNKLSIVGGDASITDNQKFILGTYSGESAIYKTTPGTQPLMNFEVGGSVKMVLGDNGNVGIGTINPTAKLQVETGNTDPNGSVVSSNIDAMIVGANGYGQSAISSRQYDSVNQPAAGDTQFLNLYYNGNTYNWYERMRIRANGNVLIGKTSQDNPTYKLDIAGKARANEIVVNSDGADFVFEPDYKLPKLSEIKTYIDQNHHLPQIPSAAEMQKNGMNVGELNTKLLQKVEELTLYLIEKDKQIEEQSKSNKLLQTTLTKIEQRLKSLETK